MFQSRSKSRMIWAYLATIFLQKKKLLLHSSLGMYLSYSTKHQLTSGMPKACKKHPSWPYLYTGYLIYGGNWALMIIVCVFPLLLACKYMMGSKVFSSCILRIFLYSNRSFLFIRREAYSIPLNPIPTGTGLNQPIYSRGVNKGGQGWQLHPHILAE